MRPEPKKKYRFPKRKDMPEPIQDLITRLRKDLAEASISDEEARYLVDTYYQMQRMRIIASNIANQQSQSGEPVRTVVWVGRVFHDMEALIKAAMDRYTDQTVPGRWAKSIVGIGPVIAGGLLADLDITRANVAGAFWSFCGQLPNNRERWLTRARIADLMERHWPPRTRKDGEQVLCNITAEIGRRPEQIRQFIDGKVTRDDLQKALARRPYSHRAKVLCWKAGESFIKHGTRKGEYYGSVYRAHKAKILEKNMAGGFNDVAERQLATKKIQSADLRKTLESGRLSDLHLHNMARRYTVKFFLAHLHHVMYEDHYGKPPPKPYVIDLMGHQKFEKPPNWPMAA